MPVLPPNAHPDGRRTNVEYTHNNVIPQQRHSVILRHSATHRHSRKKGGNPGKVTLQGEQLQEMGKSREDKMDGAERSRLERSFWCDVCLDWIPAFAGMTLLMVAGMTL